MNEFEWGSKVLPNQWITRWTTVSNSSYPLDWIIVLCLWLYNSVCEIGACYCFIKGWSRAKLRIVPKSKKLDKLFEFEFTHKVKKVFDFIAGIESEAWPLGQTGPDAAGVKKPRHPEGGDRLRPAWGVGRVSVLGVTLCFGTIIYFGINICFGI